MRPTGTPALHGREDVKYSTTLRASTASAACIPPGQRTIRSSCRKVGPARSYRSPRWLPPQGPRKKGPFSARRCSRLRIAVS